VLFSISHRLLLIQLEVYRAVKFVMCCVASVGIPPTLTGSGRVRYHAGSEVVILFIAASVI
jgi:phosphoenolpyruvate carboxylase